MNTYKYLSKICMCVNIYSSTREYMSTNMNDHTHVYMYVCIIMTKIIAHTFWKKKKTTFVEHYVA